MSKVRAHLIALLVFVFALSLPLAVFATAPGPHDRGEGGRAVARDAAEREIPGTPATAPVPPMPVEKPPVNPGRPEVPPLSATQDGRPEWAGRPDWAGKPDGVPRSSEETGKPEWAGRPDGVPRSSEETGKPEWAGRPDWILEPEEADAVENSTETTGVARARMQIERNIERAEAKVEEGLMRHVPPGLIRALEALMAWLGLAPEPAAPSGS